MDREQIRLLYIGLRRLRSDRRTRELRAETLGALRQALLDAVGGNEEVVDALFSEWDDRISEQEGAEADQRSRKELKRRHELEQRLQERFQYVYLWCRCEGWFSEGPFKELNIVERGKSIVDEQGNRIAWWDSGESCWRTQNGGNMRIADPPRISTSRKSRWK
jgi:hypothetical protein